ncbi:MerR family transcriptional regulator [Streptomyces sp. NPDC051994]|uniref:MerR family transcriptional regulator n=1 Tax=unclassified Streptomyces TaxID=2593676 RepID=UPI003430E3E2
MVDLTADLRTQLWTVAEAAEAAAVSPHVVRNWKYRGVLTQALDAAGRPVTDRQGRPLFRAIDVIRAEKATREKARRSYSAIAA